MSYNKIEVKEGINLHEIKTNNFKTNLYAIFLAIPLTRENATKNALLTAVLRRGSLNFRSQEDISRELEEMYGADFDCGIEKTGDNHILKFYISSISDEFIPADEDIDKKSIEILLDIVFNPLIENNGFKKDYVEGEKKNLRKIIEAKIDDKAQYSFDRCVEEMFKDEPYGLYKYGYIDDLDNITSEDLYNYYKELISSCKIDIFCSGTFENMEQMVSENENIKRLEARKPNYIINNEQTERKESLNIDENIVQESMQVTQGKLVIGLDVDNDMKDSRYAVSVYNAILGGGANSRLFQNVREKESLAYTAGSSYIRQKNTIFIRCGIEIANYNKALSTIKLQLQGLKDGNITEDDINNAKKLIVSAVKSIIAEQDTEITYYYGQELSDKFATIEEYINKINSVEKEQLIEIANSVSINTIYFLKN